MSIHVNNYSSSFSLQKLFWFGYQIVPGPCRGGSFEQIKVAIRNQWPIGMFLRWEVLRNEVLKLWGASTCEPMTLEMTMKWHERIHAQLTAWINEAVKHSTNEPCMNYQWIKESMVERRSEPMNRWINESVSQWTSEPVSQWINEPMADRVSEPKKQWIREPMNQWVTEWRNQRINDSTVQWTNDSMNQWTNESMSQWLDNESVNQSMSQSMNQSTNQWINQSINQ